MIKIITTKKEMIDSTVTTTKIQFDFSELPSLASIISSVKNPFKKSSTSETKKDNKKAFNGMRRKPSGRSFFNPFNK